MNDLQGTCACRRRCPACGGCELCCPCLPDRAKVEAARSAFADSLPPERAAEWSEICAAVDAETQTRTGVADVSQPAPGGAR